MTNFFRRMPLTYKLLLLGIISLIFLFVLSVQLHNEKSEKITMMEGFLSQIENSNDLTTLIDELQNERRYSFDYTLKDQQPTDLMLQRGKTDEALKKLTEKKNSDPNLLEYTFLGELSEIRSRIDLKRTNPFDVMTYFTNVIFRLSTINNVSVGNVPNLRSISQELDGQKLLSDMITYLGIVKSNIYYTLYTKQISEQAYGQAKQVYDIYNTFVKEFQLKSSPASIATYKALQTNEGGMKRTIDYLNNTLKLGRIDTSMDADTWWQVSNEATDQLRYLQQTLLQNVQDNSAEIYEEEKNKKNWNLLFLALSLALVFAVVFYISKLISESLNELKEAAQKIALGGTDIDLNIESKDAIGSLAQSIKRIDESNKTLSIAAEAIGRGNFDVPVHLRSKEDVLGMAIAKMQTDLKQYHTESEAKLWIQTGVSYINESLRGEKDMQHLCKDSLAALSDYLNCELGVFYTTNEDKLHYCAGYAISSDHSLPRTISFGETLIGQTALKKEITHLKNIPENFIKVTSASGQALPKEIVIIPLVHNDFVEGVIEVGSLSGFDTKKLDLIKELSSDIAIALQSAKSRTRLQELLEETQAQAEELQAQHSELENLNTELETQAQRLQASEEELKVQQEELLQTNKELEERSRLLEEKNQLIVERNLEIQKKAEELALSTKYKSEFLANMSHELRTPLNSILLLSRLLSENNEKNLTTDQVEYAEVIQSSGKGLLSLIDEILDLSKIEAGKMELEYSLVPVQDVAYSMRSLFGPIAKEKQLDFQVQVEEGTPSLIETDRMRLEQILKNLLSNALKFTARGSVILNIRSLSERQSFIALSVKDTGIGIPTDKQQLIFEAFQQADGSTRRKFGGTGLGLSISRELAKLLGGEIKLTSEPGKGSEFTVYLPVTKKNIKEEEELKANQKSDAPINLVVEEKEEPDYHPIGEKKQSRYTAPVIPENIPDDRNAVGTDDKVVLIIEDDTSFAKALLDYTRSKGYKGIVAVRGDEGIQLAQQYRPIGILLDIQLPVKDGWEVMEELKNNPSTRPIPVHIMSALEMKRESLMKGAVDFINKPVAFEQMQEIFQKIEHVLNKKSKKVLIVEENSKHAKALAFFLETFNVQAEISNSVDEGIHALTQRDTECVILDMGIPDNKAYETLDVVKQTPELEHIPIIIFTGKSLSKNEEQKIKQYADSIVVKTAYSYQRILDEVSLFLHLVDEHKEEDKQTTPFKRLGALNDVLNNKTILVTDDDVRNIFSLTKSLEGHKMNVLSAIDGKEALKQLEEHPEIDVVLMDIMMPEMDGYETMKRIRKNPKYRNLPIIAVTAKAMAGDREKCIQAGASDYISKPVDIDQLLSLLRVWLYEKGF